MILILIYLKFFCDTIIEKKFEKNTYNRPSNEFSKNKSFFPFSIRGQLLKEKSIPKKYIISLYLPLSFRTIFFFKFSLISCYLWVGLYSLRRHKWTKTKSMNQQTRINRRAALFPKKLSAKNSMIARNFVFCSNYSAIKLVNIIFSLFSLAAELQTYGKLVWHPLSKKTTKPLVKTV